MTRRNAKLFSMFRIIFEKAFFFLFIYFYTVFFDVQEITVLQKKKKFSTDNQTLLAVQIFTENISHVHCRTSKSCASSIIPGPTSELLSLILQLLLTCVSTVATSKATFPNSLHNLHSLQTQVLETTI